MKDRIKEGYLFVSHFTVFWTTKGYCVGKASYQYVEGNPTDKDNWHLGIYFVDIGFTNSKEEARRWLKEGIKDFDEVNESIEDFKARFSLMLTELSLNSKTA